MTVRAGQGLTGWVARNRRPLVNARPERRIRSRRPRRQPTTLQSALVAPLVFSDRFIGTLAVYSTPSRLLHRRPPPPARSRLRTGLGRHPQLDRVRADAGRFADRSAHRPAEHALHVHAPDARAGARRAPEGRSGAARHGPRQLQGDQRQPRPPRRRPRAARSGRRCCAPASARTTSASATPATSSSSCCRDAAPTKPSASASSCSATVDDVVFEARPGPPAAARDQRRRGDLSRRTATPTKRCWPPPTAACIATRPAASSACRCSRPRPAPTACPPCSVPLHAAAGDHRDRHPARRLRRAVSSSSEARQQELGDQEKYFLLISQETARIKQASARRISPVSRFTRSKPRVAAV